LTTGIPPFQILWSNGSTSNLVSNICAFTKLWVIVTDACGNTATDTFIAKPHRRPLFGGIGFTPSCQGICNGTVYSFVSVSTTPPYQFLWNNNSTANTLLDVCYDSVYTCVITDACGSTTTVQTQIPLAPAMTGSITVGSEGCKQHCGAQATLNFSGGAAPYYFIWSNNTYGQTATGLCADSNYSCMISSNGCGSASFQIHIPPTQPLTAYISSFDSSCNNSCSGSATIIASGSTPPYFFHWNNGAITASVNNLCAGLNYCVVSDTCGDFDTVSITIPTLHFNLQANLISSTNSCANICNGSATVSASGGKPPYTFVWSSGTISYYYSWSGNTPTSTATNLCFGNNYCIITDACNHSDTVIINLNKTTPLVATATTSSISCTTFCNGSASVNVVSGIPPYSYQWNSGATSTYANNLCVGNDYCIVTDACNSIDTAFVNMVSVANFITTISTNDTSCINTCNGHATLHTNGGMQPYSYVWSNGSIDSSVTNLCVGNNYCIISDACNSRDSITLNIQPVNHLNQTSFSFTGSCPNFCNGQAAVNVIGGMPPITYQWSNGATTSSINNFCVGTYTLIVSNNFCVNDSIFDTVHISNMLIANVVSVTNVTCYDSCNGSASIAVNGSNPPFNYFWNNGIFTPSSNNLCAGLFSVTIIDSIGCIVQDTFSIAQPPKISLSYNVISPHCFHNDGKIKVQASGGKPPYNYVWNTGAIGDSLLNVVAGNYTVTVFDSNNCPVNFPIQVNGLYPLLNISPDTTVGALQTVQLYANGATNYLWNPPTNLSCDSCTNPIWSGLLSQQYCVIGTDNWGCKDTACVAITTFDDCTEVLMPSAFSPNNDGVDDLLKPIYPLPSCFVSVDLRIYDRWGILLFETTDLNQGWDGTFKNKPMPIETYVWYLDVKNYFGRKLAKKGDVTIVR
jgi:gliding motility-associated-like protein